MIHYIVPVFNSAAGLSLALDNISAASRSLCERFRVFVIDDGSTDDSVETAEKHAEKGNIRVIRFKEKRGTGTAIKVGFTNAAKTAADSDPVVLVSPGGPNDPASIGAMFAKLRAGADVVTASRYFGGGSFVGFPRAKRKLVQLENYLLHAGFPLPNTTDYTCFLKMFRASIIKQSIDHFRDELLLCSGSYACVEFFIKTCLFTDQFEQVPATHDYPGKASAGIGGVYGELKDFILLFRVCHSALKDYIDITPR